MAFTAYWTDMNFPPVFARVAPVVVRDNCERRQLRAPVSVGIARPSQARVNFRIDVNYCNPNRPSAWRFFRSLHPPEMFLRLRYR
jgi:hypothetical protein